MCGGGGQQLVLFCESAVLWGSVSMGYGLNEITCYSQIIIYQHAGLLLPRQIFVLLTPKAKQRQSNGDINEMRQDETRRDKMRQDETR